MTANDALRFLAHEAARCRDRDAHEAFCLLLPALCKVVGVRPLDDVAALEFERDFHHDLRVLNQSPLVEAHCEVCGWHEAIAEVRFYKDPEGFASHRILANEWCDGCQATRYFKRSEVTA